MVLKKIKSLDIETIIFIPFLIMGFLMTTLYIFNFRVLFHSDVATANLLAREQLIDKNFFPIDWVYVQDIWVVFINNIIIFINLLVNDAVISRNISIFIQSILLVLSIYFLFKQMNMKRRSIVLLAFVFSGLSEMFSIMLFGEGPYSNIIIWVILCIALVFKIMNSEKYNKSTFLYLALILISINMTGMRYLLTLIVPLVGSLILFKYFKNKNTEKDISFSFRKMIVLLVAIGVPSFIGGVVFIYLAYNITFSKGVTDMIFVSPSEVVSNIQTYFFGTLQLFSALPQLNDKVMSLHGILYSYRTVFVFVLLIFIPSYFIKNYKVINSAYIKILLWFYLISMVSTLYIYLFGNISHGLLVTTRYFMVPVFVAFILLVCFIDLIVSRTENKIRIVFLVFLIPFLISSCFINFKSIYAYDHDQHRIVQKQNQNEPILQFLKENHLNFGFASYWNAGVITALSNFQTEVIGTIINEDIMPFYHVSSKKWYKKSYRSGNSFIMLRGTERDIFNMNRMRQFLGEPEKILDFNDYKIIVYNYNVAGKLPGWPLEKGQIIEIPGSVLPSQTGKIDNNNYRTAISGVDLPGFITYGPYTRLDVGKYKATLTYQASSNDIKLVGRWDLGYQGADQWVKISGGNLNAEDTKEKTLDVYLDIDKALSRKLIECRVFFTGEGNLSVIKLKIERLK